MAETTNNDTNQVPKYTKEQQAVRVSAAGRTKSVFEGSGQAIGQTTSPVKPAVSPTTGAAPIGGTTLIERPVERNKALEDENRRKMIASGELAADANPILAQQKVNLFTYGQEEPIFGAVDDSTAAADEVGRIMNQVNSELADTQSKMKTPEYKLYQDYEKEIRDSRAESKDLYERLMANIEEDYRIRELEQRDENRIIMGRQSKQLARMGAFGRSGSAMAYLQDVERTNQRHINKLLQEKERVLIEATKAFQEQDWDKLQTIMSENKKITDQYNDVQQQMLQDSIMSDDQVMKQARFGWEKEDREMAKMQEWASAITDWDSVSAENKRKFLDTTGMTDENARALFEANARAIKEQADFDYAKSVVELLTKVPEGRSFSIGDNVYTGWKEVTPSVFTNVQTDSQGNASLITYDKKTGQQKTFNLGRIGSADKGTYHTDNDGNLWFTPAGESHAIPVTASTSTQGGGIKTSVNPKMTDGFMEWANKLGPITADYEQAGATAFESVHMGVDIAAPVGTALDPVQPGVIIETGYHQNYGNYVQILGDDGFVYQYSHLDSIYSEVGDRVDVGTVFGTIGNTGSVQSRHSADPTKIITPEERAQGLGSHLDLRKWVYNEQLTKKSNEKKSTSGYQELRNQGFSSEFIDEIDELSKSVVIEGNVVSWDEAHNRIYSKYKEELKKAVAGTDVDPRVYLDIILMDAGLTR